jgi:CBS domain-containing protein
MSVDRLTAVAITDREKRPTGIFTISDLLRAFTSGSTIYA